MKPFQTKEEVPEIYTVFMAWDKAQIGTHFRSHANDFLQDRVSPTLGIEKLVKSRHL